MGLSSPWPISMPVGPSSDYKGTWLAGEPGEAGAARLVQGHSEVFRGPLTFERQSKPTAFASGLSEKTR